MALSLNKLFDISLDNLFLSFNSEDEKLKYYKELLKVIQKNSSINFPESVDSLDTNKLWKYIADNIDIDAFTEPLASTYLKQSKYWNESIQELFNNINDLFSVGNFVNSNGDRVFTIDDLLNSNAGKSFTDETNLVQPLKNLDNKTYDNVRGNDLASAAALNQIHLDFTNQSEIGTRLIMPQNVRRVEIEELNRNFWVIGQVLSGISMFLFDDTGLSGILKDFIDEIIQQWQNLLYLWAAAAILSIQSNKSEGIHCEVLYLPNNNVQPYKKYDFYDNYSLDSDGYINITSQQIKGKIEFLKQKYPKNDLCILPCVRWKNYWSNYYIKESYPFLYFYDRDNNKEKFVPIKYNAKIFKAEDNLNYSSIKKPFTIAVDEYYPYEVDYSGFYHHNRKNMYAAFIYGISKDNTKYGFPYSKIVNLIDNINKVKIDSTTQPYYALLEVVPKLICQRNQQRELEATLSFDIYDKARAMISSKRKILSVVIKDEESNNLLMNNSSNNFEAHIASRATINDSEGIRSFLNIKENYYKGELASYKEYSIKQDKPTFDINREAIKQNGILLKIGAFFPPAPAEKALGSKKIPNIFNFNPDNIQNNSGICLREQVAVVNDTYVKTAYECNLDIGYPNANTNTAEDIFGNISSQPNSEYYSSNVNASSIKDDTDFYGFSLDENGNLSMKKKSEGINLYGNCVTLGKDMVSQYLVANFNNSKLKSDSIIYFITAIGIKPWFGGRDAKHAQGYWSENVLCHFIRYIPKELVTDKSEYDYEVKSQINNKLYGYLETPKVVNKSEAAFGDNYFVINGGTTWRLPQLNATKNAAEYLSVIKTIAAIYQHNTIISDEQVSEPYLISYSNFKKGEKSSDKEIIDELSTWTDSQFANCNPEYILKNDLKSSGRWTVFDGQSTNNSNTNADSYATNSSFREVLYADFDWNSEDSKIAITGQIAGYRKINESDFTVDKKYPDFWGSNNTLFDEGGTITWN